MKDKPLYTIFWVCFAVIFLVNLTGSKGWAAGSDVIFDDGDRLPVVYDSNPSSDQTNVPISQVITITFTAYMDKVSTSAAFHFYVEGTDAVLNNLKESGALRIGGQTDLPNLIFTPASDLKPGTKYWIKIESTAKDLEGNYLDGDNNNIGDEGWKDDWEMSFTTAATNPLVNDSDPNSNQFDVPLSQHITITFTTHMNKVSTAGAFYFYAEGTDEDLDNLKGSGTLKIGGQTEPAELIFTPAADLQPGTTYWVKIKSSAKDLEGDRLDSDHDGIGGEQREDDWKIRFTTVPPLPSTGGNWSQIYDQTHGGLKGKVSCLAVDSRDRLWVAAKKEEESDIYCFDGRTWVKKTSTLADFQISEFSCIAIDDQDQVWVGLDTYQKNADAPKLAKWENNAWQPISANDLDLSPDEGIIEAATDSLGNVWIVTFGGKIYKYSHGQKPIDYSDDLPESSITSIVIDPENNVWVGTTFFGVYKLAYEAGTWASTWKSYPYKITQAGIISTDTVNYNITDMGAGSAGIIWVGTNKGLLKLDLSAGPPGVWKHYTQANTDQGLPGDLVMALAVSPGSGMVWVGTSSGLGRFDGSDTWTNFAVDNANALSGQTINALALNSRGEAWVGTDSGLAMRDDVNPLVVARDSFPADHAQVNTALKVRIVFSEPMNVDAAQSAFTLKDTDQKTIGGTFSWSADKRMLEFTPQPGALKANQSYTVLMNTSAKDLLGNPLAPKEYTATFSTSGGQSSVRSRSDLSGSGCFIESLGSRSAWLNRLLKCSF